MPAIDEKINLKYFSKPLPRGMVCFPEMMQAAPSVPDELKTHYKGRRSHGAESGMIETDYLVVDSPPIFFIRALQTYEINHIAAFAKSPDFFMEMDSFSMRLLETLDQPITNAHLIDQAVLAYRDKAKNIPEKAVTDYRINLITAVCGIEYLGTLNQYNEKEWLQELISSEGLSGEWKKEELKEFKPVDFPFATILFANESDQLNFLVRRIWELTTGGHRYIQKKPMNSGKI